MNMARPIRILFVILSLICCIALCALWIRSHHGSDYISRGRLVRQDRMLTESEHLSLQMTQGQVRFINRNVTLYHLHAFSNSRPPDFAAHWSTGRLGVGHLDSNPPEAVGFWQRLGFMKWKGGWESSFADESWQTWAFPTWLAAFAFAILPIFELILIARRLRRQSASVCIKCGYDLRASIDRCPECGTTFSPLKA